MNANKNINNMNKQQTAVDWLIEQLQAPCRGIPTHIIEQAKAMEAEQIINARVTAPFLPTPDSEVYKIEAEHYYNKTFKTQYK